MSSNSFYNWQDSLAEPCVVASEKRWPRQVLAMQVKLVGSTISCEPVHERGDPKGRMRHNAHVQSYVMATDQVDANIPPPILKGSIATHIKIPLCKLWHGQSFEEGKTQLFRMSVASYKFFSVNCKLKWKVIISVEVSRQPSYGLFITIYKEHQPAL